GALDAMLTRTAETFEQDTSLALDRLLAALVPVVTLLLAGVVGIVVLAVLTPLYDLTSAIG
ncbi:type II secretion system F family protein, partial [Acinetobacter baumannii]